MRSDVMDEVATILRQAAAEAILPRYRKLLAGDVEEKTPGEVVTVAATPSRLSARGWPRCSLAHASSVRKQSPRIRL